MPRFDYRATDAAGEEVADTLDAASVAEAAAQLESRGLTLIAISRAEAADQPADATPIEVVPLEAVERLFACRDRLVDPLTAYVRELPAGRRRQELRARVETLASGSLAEVDAAARSNPLGWAPLLAAATSDESATVFARFVERDQRGATLRRRKNLAFAYPFAVLALALLVSWPIVAQVIPIFRDIFWSFGLELPALTVFILSAGAFLERGGWWVLLGAPLLAWGVWATAPWWAPAWLKRGMDRLASRGQGGAIASARVTRHVADLVEARLPMAEALTTAGDRVGGAVGEAASWLAPRLADEPTHELVASGDMRSFGYAVGADLPTPSRVRLLRELSACHSERSAGRTSWARGAAGPLVVVALGIVVGLVAIGLFLPLVRLVEGLS